MAVFWSNVKKRYAFVYCTCCNIIRVYYCPKQFLFLLINTNDNNIYQISYILYNFYPFFIIIARISILFLFYLYITIEHIFIGIKKRKIRYYILGVKLNAYNISKMQLMVLPVLHETRIDKHRDKSSYIFFWSIIYLPRFLFVLHPAFFVYSDNKSMVIRSRYSWLAKSEI